MISGSMPNSAVLRPDLADLKVDALRYVGNFSNEPLACVVRRDAGIDSIDDLRSEDFVFGSDRAGQHDLRACGPSFKKALAASFDIVTGFKGVAGINSAILRNEIDGRCGVPLSRFATRYDPEVMEVVILVGPADASLADAAPTLLSLIEDPSVRRGCRVCDLRRWLLLTSTSTRWHVGRNCRGLSYCFRGFVAG